jgi:hypothetical protein
VSTLNRQAQSANLITIQFDGETMGIIQTVRFSGDFGLTDESGIGQNTVWEYVPGIAHINVSASGIVLFANNLLKAGIVPSTGVREVLQGKVIDITLFSKAIPAVGSTAAKLPRILLKATYCSVASIDVGISTGKAISFDATFRAIDLIGDLIGTDPAAVAT